MRKSREKTQEMLESFAILLKNTTWKCGKIERAVVDYLRKQFHRKGEPATSISEIIQNFNLKGKQKSEFLDAIRRLEKRRIIKIEFTYPS